MIKLIGIKRTLILAILLAANLAVAGVLFLGILPMKSRASNQLVTVQGEISTLQGKISNVKQELEDFKRNLPKYEMLKSGGFFSGQDRFQLERDLAKVQEVSGVEGFSYNVSEVKTVENDDAKRSSSRIIKSEITIENPYVLVDGDFYGLVYAMMGSFPSHVRLQSFELSRKYDLDNETLKKIRTQELKSLLGAKAIFEWMTIVPEEDKTKTSGWGR